MSQVQQGTYPWMSITLQLPGPSFETRYLQTCVGENKAAKIGDIAKVTYRSRYVENNDWSLNSDMKKSQPSLCALLRCALIWPVKSADANTCWIHSVFDRRKFLNQLFYLKFFRCRRMWSGLLDCVRHWRKSWMNACAGYLSVAWRHIRQLVECYPW